MIKVREVRIAKEVKRSDDWWRFSCGDVSTSQTSKPVLGCNSSDVWQPVRLGCNILVCRKTNITTRGRTMTILETGQSWILWIVGGCLPMWLSSQRQDCVCLLPRIFKFILLILLILLKPIYHFRLWPSFSHYIIAHIFAKLNCLVYHIFCNTKYKWIVQVIELAVSYCSWAPSDCICVIARVVWRCDVNILCWCTCSNVTLETYFNTLQKLEELIHASDIYL